MGRDVKNVKEQKQATPYAARGVADDGPDHFMVITQSRLHDLRRISVGRKDARAATLMTGCRKSLGW